MTLVTFGIPKTKAVQFEKIFKVNGLESQSHLRAATLARDEVVNSMEQKVPPSNLSQVLERYLPHLMGIVNHVGSHPNLKPQQPLKFNWSFVMDEDAKAQTVESIWFELAMVLLSMAFCRADMAQERLAKRTKDEDLEETLKYAANDLKKAAGICDYVNSSVYPQWLDVPKKRPVDLHPHVATSLSDFFVAMAQKLAVQQAEKRSTSSVLVAKLSVGAYRRFDASLKALKLLSESEYRDVAGDFKMFIQMEQALNRSIAMRHLATDAFSERNEKYGLGVSLIALADKQMAEISHHRHLAYKLNPTEIAEEGEEIKSLKRKYEYENDMIYYDRKVDHTSLEAAIPEGRMIMEAEKFTPPPPAFESL